MRQVILDVETKKAFSEVGGHDLSRLGVSFVGVIEREEPFTDGRELRFFEKDLDDLWFVLERADVVVGFNIAGFDFPVMAPYYAGEVSQFPVLDLLERIKEQAGHRVSLDAVAKKTLGVGKSGSGLDALKYYAEGRMEKLADYCMDDVRITRDIYDFGLKNKQVKFLNKWNRVIELPIDFEFKPGGESGVQMTLA